MPILQTTNTLILAQQVQHQPKTQQTHCLPTNTPTNIQLPVNKCIVYPITCNYKSLEQSGTKPNQNAYDIWHCSLMAMIKLINTRKFKDCFLIDESLYSVENNYEKLGLACIY